MKILEVLVVMVVVLGFVVYDYMYNMEESIALREKTLKYKEIKLEDKLKLTPKEMKILDKNVWHLKSVEKLKKAKKITKSEYTLKDNNKTICFKENCFELVATKGSINAIFYGDETKKFISVRVGDILDGDLVLKRIAKYVVLKGKKQIFYLKRGYIDSQLYKPKGENNDTKE